MPAEQTPIDLDLPPPDTVVEFDAVRAARRRWSPANLARNLTADPRLVPLAASLGAVAILASLISEWQTTTMDGAFYGDAVGQRLIPTGVTDLGALGAGYLIGLFPLVTAIVLTMFGPPAGRRYCRLAGLSVAGTLLGLLLALATSLSDQSRVVSRLYTLELDGNRLTLGYGRGLWCAVAGVLLAMVAFSLADRQVTVRPILQQCGAAPAEETAAAWSWRRPPGPHDERGPDEPLDLTVAPAKPFTSLSDDRDKPA